MFPAYVHEAVEAQAGDRLGSTLRRRLLRCVDSHAERLGPLGSHNTLVHADYKARNILMRRHPQEAGWEVAAILDWEFSCAGPPLIDFGLFLRRGAALPRGYKEAFADGYRRAGGELPAEWFALSRLLDLISQCTFLNEEVARPRIIAESIEVLTETLDLLEQTG